jgi:ubiquinone biosynthesis O-methyltransferase
MADSRSLDAIFAEYSEEDGFERELLRLKIAEVSRFVKGHDVLDIGCGTGILVAALAVSGRTVTGVDGSAAKIEIARENYSDLDAQFKHVMFESVEFEPEFDTVIATNVLEHVDSPAEFIAMCRGALRPGGRLIFTVPNATSLHKRIGLHMGLIDDLYALTDADLRKGHTRIYDAETLLVDLEESGFVVDHIGGILLKPLSNDQMESWDRPVIEALYEIGREMPELSSSLIVVADLPASEGA